ncbi:MAG TPA: hypothetical protein VD838_10405 [Anaeromyxobacteraceae bacterium]|nr:hypothetical protein [Anaeromyxobacteraceae bacterium]
MTFEEAQQRHADAYQAHVAEAMRLVEDVGQADCSCVSCRCGVFADDGQCGRCFPACAGCNVPMPRESLTRDGRDLLCESCLERARECQACGGSGGGAGYWRCQRCAGRGSFPRLRLAGED